LCALPPASEARFVNCMTDSASDWGSPARSVLYAHPFNVEGTAIHRALLTLAWAVDDLLGGLDYGDNRSGAYLNGEPLGEMVRGGAPNRELEAVIDVTSYLVPGK